MWILTSEKTEFRVDAFLTLSLLGLLAPVEALEQGHEKIGVAVAKETAAKRSIK